MFIFRVMPLEFINITKPLKLLVTTPTTAENGGTAEKIIPLSSTQTSQSCPCWCCHQQAEMFIFRVVQREFINITKPLKLLVTTPTTAENGGTAEKIIPLSSTQTSQSCYINGFAVYRCHPLFLIRSSCFFQA